MQLSDSQTMQISPSQILSDFRTYLQATIVWTYGRKSSGFYFKNFNHTAYHRRFLNLSQYFYLNNFNYHAPVDEGEDSVYTAYLHFMLPTY